MPIEFTFSYDPEDWQETLRSLAAESKKRERRRGKKPDAPPGQEAVWSDCTCSWVFQNKVPIVGKRRKGMIIDDVTIDIVECEVVESIIIKRLPKCTT